MRQMYSTKKTLGMDNFGINGQFLEKWTILKNLHNLEEMDKK